MRARVVGGGEKLIVRQSLAADFSFCTKHVRGVAPWPCAWPSLLGHAPPLHPATANAAQTQAFASAGHAKDFASKIWHWSWAIGSESWNLGHG
jgi:hypothetical protein